MRIQLRVFLVLTTIFGVQSAFAAMPVEPMEIYCTIRTNNRLNCQVLGKERRVMNAEDIANFIDAGEVAAYVTLKSRKDKERTFMIDGHSPQYKHLAEVKRQSISEIAKAKSDIFNDIEKKVIKMSDDLDAQAAAADLVLADPSVTYDKMKREARSMKEELEGFKKSKDKTCTSAH